MTTTPDEPLNDDDMTTAAAGPTPPTGHADGTDSDGTDSDGTDSDGTDGDASDGDATDTTDGDADRRHRLGRHRLRRHRHRRGGRGPERPHGRRRVLSALDLLSGDAQTFLTKVWASRVHLHRTDPDDLVGLLSFDDVDRLLTSSAIRTPSVRLARDGAVLPESSYTRGATLAGRPLTGLVDAGKAAALFDAGATVVLQGLHRYHQPLTELVAELELELGHPCQANAYLTPPGSQGFAVHSDTHDVFVLQTAGAKRWEVHTPDGVEDVLLEPGLSMYLPSGTPHAARAQDTVSLHVTIGINQLTWRGLVERSVRDALAAVGDEHLPAGYLEEPERLTEGLARRLEQLAGRVREVDAAAAVETEVRRFLTTRPPRLSGGLRDVLARPRAGRRHAAASPSRAPLRAAGRRGRPARGAARRPLAARAGLAPPGPRGGPGPPGPHAGRPRRPARPPEPAGALPAPGPGRAARGRRVSATPEPPYRCTAASVLRDEPALGSASTVRAFLLVEHPGPWGTDALRDARLPDGLGDRLRAASARTGVRVLLVRRQGARPGARPGGPHPRGSSRRTPTPTARPSRPAP